MIFSSTFYCYYMLFSGKVWWREGGFGKVTLLSIWQKKVWQINRSANRILIESASLDRFSLANHQQFAKLAKLSPAKLSCYTVITSVYAYHFMSDFIYKTTAWIVTSNVDHFYVFPNWLFTLMPRQVLCSKPMLVYIVYSYMYAHTFTLRILLIKVTHEDYIVLASKWLERAFLQFPVACLPSILLGIPIPAKYKEAKSMT